MKIIKVIVDELPKACINCGYGHLKDGSYCTLSQCRRIDINPYISRPDWCPLMTINENEKIVKFVFKGQGHIEPNRETWEIDLRNPFGTWAEN